jgi:hypothetical protein
MKRIVFAFPLPTRSSEKAAALIIVLAFVVLLTGLALAYFTRTTTDRQLAQSSYNDTSADSLAHSALDIIVGDFQQEIVNGSISPVPAVSPVQTSGPFIPSQTPYVVPQRNVSASLRIPNLIRISLRGDPIATPAVGSRAAGVNSTNDPSANGRSISTTRWNKHCLLPPGNGTPVPTINNPSPIPSFTPPDWVIVTRAGPTPFASWTSTLADPTNTNYAVGRYAYAVYDEGGLLDINVAGYPSPVPASPIPAYTFDAIARKGVLAMADLTAIIPTPTPSGANMGTFINKIVGFRNYATVGQNNVSTWVFPFSGLTNGHIFNFVKYFLGGGVSQTSDEPKVGTSRDFGAVNAVPAQQTQDGRTDQSFVTRAELIQFCNNAGTGLLSDTQTLSMLQYLGTFSREKNQPTLPLTPAWPFTRVVLPQRFPLYNLNLVVYPSPTPTPTVTPTPTATPTLTPTIRTALGLQFVSAASPTPTPPPPTPTATPTPSPCIGQVRWEYVGNQGTPNPTATPSPLPYIPAFPSDLTTLDFFQYINYALFGRTDNDSTDMPYTLGIGAALIDLYDADSLLTGIYYGSSALTTCDTGIAACLVYGAEQNTSGFPPYTVRTQAPTCIAAPSPPDTFNSSFIPPVNLPTRTVGDFAWAYSILDAANNRNTNANPNFVIDFKDAYNSARNPDPALLDFFTYNSSTGYQGAPVRSGVVSLNTQQPLVLAAILKSALYQGTSLSLNQAQAVAAANSIVTSTTASHAMSRADIASLVAPLVAAGTKPFNTSPSQQDIQDVIARALSETTQTRTWGLLIDLVAQTGHYKPNMDPQSCNDPNHNCLADFVVEGEKRYWLHIAIDRFDGSIVGQQLEEVTE